MHYFFVSRGRYSRDASTSGKTWPEARRVKTLTILETTEYRSKGYSGEYLTGKFPSEEGGTSLILTPIFYHHHHHGWIAQTDNSVHHRSVRCRRTFVPPRRPAPLSYPISYYLFWSCHWRASFRIYRLPRMFACSGGDHNPLESTWLVPARRGKPSSVCTPLLPPFFDRTAIVCIGKLPSLSSEALHREEAIYLGVHHLNISGAFGRDPCQWEREWLHQRSCSSWHAEYARIPNICWMAARKCPKVSAIYQVSSMSYQLERPWLKTWRGDESPRNLFVQDCQFNWHPWGISFFGLAT